MSVTSSLNPLARIDPIKGQAFLMRFMGNTTVTGDGSGGYALMSIGLPAPSFEHPFWILTDLDLWASTSAAGDATLSIASNDPLIGSGNTEVLFVDLAALPAAMAGAGMAMKQDVQPRRWSNFLHRYNADATAGIYPSFGAWFTNTNAVVYYMIIKGYFIDEKYLPQAMVMFNIN